MISSVLSLSSSNLMSIIRAMNYFINLMENRELEKIIKFHKVPEFLSDTPVIQMNPWLRLYHCSNCLPLPLSYALFQSHDVQLGRFYTAQL